MKTVLLSIPMMVVAQAALAHGPGVHTHLPVGGIAVVALALSLGVLAVRQALRVERRRSDRREF